MKRDFELIREILLKVESSPAGEIITQLEIDSTSDESTVIEHIELLIEAGLIEGQVTLPDLIAIRRLTNAGHDFLESARNNNVWEKVLNMIRSKGGSMTIEVMTSLLTETSKKLLGL